MNKQEKPKEPMTERELESGVWVLDYVASEMVDVRMIHQHELVLAPRNELEVGISELVGRFGSVVIEPMRRYWLEGQNRE